MIRGVWECKSKYEDGLDDVVMYLFVCNED